MDQDDQDIYNTVYLQTPSQNGLKMDEGVNIRFTAFVPKMCLKSREMNICFLLEDTAERIQLINHFTYDNNDQSFYYRIFIDIFVPYYLLKMKRRIAYFYYTRNDTAENLVLELNKLRCMSNELLLTVNNIYTSNNQRYTNQYDGVVLFDQISYLSDPDYYKSLKGFVIADSLTIHKLRSDRLKKFFPDFLENIHRLYDCLCIDDLEYRQYFDQVTMRNKFSFF